jgi:hypothetical protein
MSLTQTWAGTALQALHRDDVAGGRLLGEGALAALGDLDGRGVLPGLLEESEPREHAQKHDYRAEYRTHRALVSPVALSAKALSA